MFNFINEWLKFKNSNVYWNNRYNSGGNSGSGSYDEYALNKIIFVNNIIKSKNINSMLDMGCGDGNNIINLTTIKEYVGFDISENALDRCRKIHGVKSWMNFTNKIPTKTFDCTLSMEVIFHLIENKVFEEYMDSLFSHSDKYVIIVSTDNKKIKLSAPL